jgi:hypothetical protein
MRDGAVFLDNKSSNKIETVQYFKKHFFLLTNLRILRPNQNRMKQSDLGKSLDPSTHTVHYIYSTVLGKRREGQRGEFTN